MKFTTHKSTITTGTIKNNPLFLLCAGLCISQAAFSDATVSYEQIVGEKKSLNIMKIKEGTIRFTPPNQNNNYSLYNSKNGELTHVDSSKKQYLIIDKKIMTQQAQSAKKRMDSMRKEMEKRMKDMPPEQKKQVERMMNNHLSHVENKTPDNFVQKKTSRTEKISGIECTVYESYINAVKSNEICMTSPEQLGISTQDAQALMSVQAFMKHMQKIAQEMMGTNIPSSDLQGVPLHTTLFAPDGSIKMQTRLSGISTETINSDVISIPAGFSMQQVPEMPR